MSEFLQMGGYAEFVWSSYAIWLVVMLLNYVQPLRKEKRTLTELEKKHKLKQK